MSSEKCVECKNHTERYCRLCVKKVCTKCKNDLSHERSGKCEVCRKLRAVIENTMDVICSFDIEGKFDFVSPSVYENWLYRPSEVIGRRFMEIIVSEDIPQTVQSVRAIRADDRNVVVGFENRVRRKDGIAVNIWWTAYWSETEKSMFCIAHDITQRKLVEEAIKASEARIRSIIDHIAVGLLLITPKGIIESCNPRTQTMLGYRAEEIVGRHILCLFADSKFLSEYDVNDCAQFMESFYGKTQEGPSEFDCLRKYGDELSVDIVVSEFHQQEGLRYMAHLIDVSGRRRNTKAG